MSDSWQTRNETLEAWCLRHWTYVDAEMERPVDEYIVQGRDSTLERWTDLAVIPRNMCRDGADLRAQIEREAEAGGCRHSRVLAKVKGRKNQIGTKSLGDYRPTEVDLEESHGSPAAQMAQAHRHNEVLMRMVLGMREGDHRRVEERERHLRQLEQDLMLKKLELVAVAEEMLDRKGERELRLMRNMTVNKGLDAVIGGLRTHLLGLPVADGEKGQALVEALADLAASFDEAQLAKLTASGLLRADQQVALLSLMHNAAEATEEKVQDEGVPPAVLKQLRNLPEDERVQAYRLLRKARQLGPAPEEKDGGASHGQP